MLWLDRANQDMQSRQRMFSQGGDFCRVQRDSVMSGITTKQRAAGKAVIEGAA